MSGAEYAAFPGVLATATATAAWRFLNPLGHVGFKISQPGDWPVPTFHSLRKIHNQGGETTSNGRPEPFFFSKLTKSNPTRPTGLNFLDFFVLFFFN